MRRSLAVPARLILVAAALLQAACASARGSDSGDADPSRRSTGTRIGCDEIRSVNGASTAYDLVLRLRPTWLQTRGRISVYAEPGMGLIVDGRPAESLDQLGDVPARAVLRIERLQSGDAKQYGQFPQGAIAVTTGSC